MFVLIIRGGESGYIHLTDLVINLFTIEVHDLLYSFHINPKILFIFVMSQLPTFFFPRGQLMNSRVDVALYTQRVYAL